MLQAADHHVIRQPKYEVQGSFMVAAVLAAWEWGIPALPVDNWWVFTIVLIVLVVAIWAIARLTTSVNGDIDPSEIDRQMLTAVSELHSQGELTPEEYRSIKSRLVNRLSEFESVEDTPPSDHEADRQADDKPQMSEVSASGDTQSDSSQTEGNTTHSEEQLEDNSEKSNDHNSSTS